MVWCYQALSLLRNILGPFNFYSKVLTHEFTQKVGERMVDEFFFTEMVELFKLECPSLCSH